MDGEIGPYHLISQIRIFYVLSLFLIGLYKITCVAVAGGWPNIKKRKQRNTAAVETSSRDVEVCMG
jgi:hypothetical protein